MEPPRVLKPRSQNGCERCRKRRQKCDEQRPVCTRCRKATGVVCVYGINLRWGGRQFEKSRFGKCQVQRVETSRGSFVYSSEYYAQNRSPSPTLQQTAGSLQQTSRLAIATPGAMPRNIGLLPGLTPDQKSLLHHFVHEASSLISCNRQIQSQTCQVLLPLSLEVSALLHAVLAFSAGHRASIGENEDRTRMFKMQLVTTRNQSIRELHHNLDPLNSSHLEATLATSLMLCLCALRYDEEAYNSWRIHLNGARATISAISRLPNSESLQSSTRFSYLKKRYTILETIALQGLNGFHARDLDYEIAKQDAQPAEVFLDDYVGCATDVLEMFQEVSAVAWETRRARAADGKELVLSQHDFDLEAFNLETRLLQMIDRDRKSSPVFCPGVQAMLSPRQIADYVLFNELVQYTVLLVIRRRIRRLSPSNSLVQECVGKIIQLANFLTPSNGLSPGLGLNEVLFAAGCSCLEPDRDSIRRLLNSFYHSTQNHNTILALRILEEHWTKMGSAQESDDSSEVHTNIDFIAY
ncbi:hypothetical protein PV04_09731 [Phialophora macrospora]|uniref:Zn(2)-C6 fungal-type domain-containing protein n=1 Tax=Phialophora macrospora TaxID=1851006 RepID=A0A0D2FY45_9EURO|nr:hypothetical protein PV04_09731 [Phialophora macrospora]